MKSNKYILLSAFVAVLILGSGLYSSCSKDVCKAVSCINGGSCGGGSCLCQKGVGGLNCEIIYRDLYKNVYKGTGTNDTGKAYIDNTLTFTAGFDTSYTQMQLIWNNHGASVVDMSITLNSNTASGSTFTISPRTVNSKVYTGFGNVNGVNASVTINEMQPDSSVRVIMLNNFTKQ